MQLCGLKSAPRHEARFCCEERRRLHCVRLSPFVADRFLMDDGRGPFEDVRANPQAFVSQVKGGQVDSGMTPTATL